LKVCTRLQEAGYTAFLVGGCVRDLMLGREPKDFDVVTSALPEEIRGMFRGARLIGRRFRLAHVRMGHEILEVATFRATPVADGDGEEAEGWVDNNIFGTQEEDARRRDFTVNALYLDTADLTVVDYVGGLEDLRQGVLRVIGDPEVRYREDPVRMLRVVRFAAKLGFRLDEGSDAALRTLAPELRRVSPARLFDEALKLFHSGYALETYELLRKYHLFEHLFPSTEQSLEIEQEGFPITLVPRALQNTDARIAENKPVTPAFLFAAILWEPVRLDAVRRIANGMHPHEAYQLAAESVLHEQLQHISIPKRFSFPMREIWAMQSKFPRRTGKSAFRLMEHKRFRAAYDFLLLRAEMGEESQELADWWTRFQAVGEDERVAMTQSVEPIPVNNTVKRRARRRRSGRRAVATG
jgi:poly(A) polymerase